MGTVLLDVLASNRSGVIGRCSSRRRTFVVGDGEYGVSGGCGATEFGDSKSYLFLRFLLGLGESRTDSREVLGVLTLKEVPLELRVKDGGRVAVGEGSDSASVSTTV